MMLTGGSLTSGPCMYTLFMRPSYRSIGKNDELYVQLSDELQKGRCSVLHARECLVIIAQNPILQVVPLRGTII